MPWVQTPVWKEGRKEEERREKERKIVKYLSAQ
jgi:hypothetical protein